MTLIDIAYHVGWGLAILTVVAALLAFLTYDHTMTIGGTPTGEFRTRVTALGEHILEQKYTGTCYGDEVMGVYDCYFWKRVQKLSV